ncbi:hypothetical protein N658DRAFT_37072 [Parathielavia hyrcaniae]|uniref:Aminoglycoside phosphotransferase domain-containing protein n=1 Tax=Parathielavia hyrcaniae TaxID=113614 RepID=A0AAN6QDV7_9PEZI|nr:hypothetical protein N658DRAFT_37072 [Parathielavia hyrcaniae]
MPANHALLPGDAEEDGLAPFGPILAVVRLDKAAERAIELWSSKHPKDPRPRPPVVGAPIHGSYHILFPLVFNDRGTRWLLKVPIDGIPGHWNNLCADALESEAQTMQLIRKHTSIPVPDVFGYSTTLDNDLGCPHIWLSFIDGVSLDDFWFAEPQDMSEEDRHRRRTRVLRSVASAMVQLSKFSFNEGGQLVFESDGRLSGVARRRELDVIECERRLEHGEYMPAYFSSGPYKTAGQFYTSSLHRQVPDSEFLLGQRRLLHFFLVCVDDFFTADRQSFVVTHPDLDLQNFIVSPQGDLVGIIDWDGVGAWPKSLGNLRYPSWLTRDWDPGMYGYGSDGVLHDAEMREDSPQTLARCREVYCDAIREALAEDRIGGHSQAYHTGATLITENLHIAATNPVGRGNILRKIVQEIAKLAEVPCSDEEFLYMELCHSFGHGEGKLREGVLGALRTGLTKLLQNESL